MVVLLYFHLPHFYHVIYIYSNISSMRRSVSSPVEMPRDKLQGVSSGDETLCRMLDITSQTKLF